MGSAGNGSGSDLDEVMRLQIRNVMKWFDHGIDSNWWICSTENITENLSYLQDSDRSPRKLDISALFDHVYALDISVL